MGGGMRKLAALLICFLGLDPAWAQNLPAPDDAQARQAYDALPKPVRAKLLQLPDWFAEDMAKLISGYGGPDGIDAEAVELHIAVTRAGARASTTAMLMQADLDDDGTVTRDEVEAFVQTCGATTRGKLRRLFARADTDANAQVSPAELRVESETAALRSLNDDRALVLRSLLLMDLDGNTLVSMNEVIRVSAIALRESAKQDDGQIVLLSTP